MVERSLSMREVPGSMPGSSILKKCSGFYLSRRPFISQRRALVERQSSISSLTFSRCSEIGVKSFTSRYRSPLSFRLNCLKIFEMQRDLSMHNSIITYVRMAERSKAPDSRVTVSSHDYQGAFWSTNVGVGSNPTSDKIFFKVIQIHILTKPSPPSRI